MNETEPLNNPAGIINIHKESLLNKNFRKEIWTGKHLQVTVMSIPPKSEIGIELHNNLDQFIRIQSGIASLYLGKTKKDIKFAGNANFNDAILIPAGTWHNILNKQNRPLKLYSIYAPPNHPIGAIHKTKLESDIEE